MENKNEIINKEQGTDITNNLDTFGSIQGFENTCRMAKALSSSTIVPKEYQGNIGNCLIALDVAHRVDLSPIMVMQNLYVVNGRPAWGSQSIAALINTSKKYAKPLQYKMEGSGDNLSCYAYTFDQEGNEIIGPTITMKMAKDEGWTNKSGSKWNTMPEIMIRYRATAFFGRLHCSELLLGIYSADETLDMEPATVIEITHEEVKKEINQNANQEILDIPVEEIQAEEVKNGASKQTTFEEQPF
ncbi:hypothetical protein [Clostridium butyricum]|uniref:hypothetical protein n=1 Tax=Clostridium butyricum TaxID=1492 RepID=UPI0009043067|nr:hypothetical protein [Clostridium butyricum]APF21023.1 hypothetical protein NPD4_3492 [Clostridium butyricum]